MDAGCLQKGKERHTENKKNLKLFAGYDKKNTRYVARHLSTKELNNIIICATEYWLDCPCQKREKFKKGLKNEENKI